MWDAMAQSRALLLAGHATQYLHFTRWGVRQGQAKGRLKFVATSNFHQPSDFTKRISTSHGFVLAVIKLPWSCYQRLLSRSLSRFVWFAHHPALSPANGREARGTCCIGEGAVRISCRHGSATSSVDLCFWQMWRGNDISAFVIPSRGRT